MSDTPNDRVESAIPRDLLALGSSFAFRRLVVVVIRAMWILGVVVQLIFLVVLVLLVMAHASCKPA